MSELIPPSNYQPSNGASSGGSYPGDANNMLQRDDASHNGTPGDGAPYTANDLARRITPQYVAPPRVVDEEEANEGFNLQRFLVMLRRRRWLMAATFACVFVLGMGYTFMQKPVYQSIAQIQVSTPANPGGASNNSLLQGVAQQEQTNLIGTQIAILQSPPLWRAALKKLSPEEQAEVNKFPRIDIRPVRDAEIISVSVLSHKPPVAMNMANAICEQFIQENKKQNQEAVEAATNYVQGQLGPAKQRLDQAALRLKEYQQKNNTVDIGKEASSRIEQVTSVEAAQHDAEVQRLAAIAESEQLRAEIAKMGATVTGQTTIAASPEAAALKSELTQLEIKRAQAANEYTPQSHEIRSLNDQISVLNSRLNQVAATSVGSVTKNINPARMALVQNLATAQGQVWALEARSKALLTTAQQARAELSRLPAVAYNLSQLTLDQSILEDSYKNLNEKYQSLRISKEASLANVHIIAPGDLPAQPVSPNKKLNLILTVVLGMLLALALGAGMDHLDDRVHSDEDVENITGLPVLAHIPFIKEEALQCLVGNTGKTSPLLESYRMLRSNIAFAGIDEPLRSVVVTSSQPSEGKSVSSMNLATVMALGGKRVVVVDCDLRRPKLHRLLGLPNNIGFSSVVAGQATLEEALRPTDVPGLQVLTSGPIPPNPPELLDSRTGRAVLQQIIDQADFVVLDTPPAMAMTDAQIVASLANGIILVVSSTEAGKREIARTNSLLARTGIKRLGVVLNKLSEDDGSYYGYYGYKAYGEYLKSSNDGDDTGTLETGISGNDVQLNGNGSKGHNELTDGSHRESKPFSK